MSNRTTAVTRNEPLMMMMVEVNGAGSPKPLQFIAKGLVVITAAFNVWSAWSGSSSGWVDVQGLSNASPEKLVGTTVPLWLAGALHNLMCMWQILQKCGSATGRVAHQPHLCEVGGACLRFKHPVQMFSAFNCALCEQLM